jgi:transcriptional regulator with XRE-family HTH domain
MVGARARIIRIDRGFSQQAVADAIGVTFQQIQKYEKGAKRISTSTLAALSKLFVVRISDFFADFELRDETDTAADISHYNTAQAIHVANAFSAISNQNTRRRFLSLVTTISGERPRPGSG